MITIRDNRKSENYRPQVSVLNVGEFFEYQGCLFMKTYEGSPTHFECFNFHSESMEHFDGTEEVKVLENITITIENN